MQSMGFDSQSTILDPTALASNEANPSSISEDIFSLSKQEDCGVENLTFVSKKDGNFVVAVSKSEKIVLGGFVLVHFLFVFCVCVRC